MPRVNYGFTAKNNKLKDLPGFIKKKMYDSNSHGPELADKMGITKQALSYRMSKCREGKDLFTYGDLLTLFKETGATDAEILEVMRL